MSSDVICLSESEEEEEEATVTTESEDETPSKRFKLYVFGNAGTYHRVG